MNNEMNIFSIVYAYKLHHNGCCSTWQRHVVFLFYFQSAAKSISQATLIFQTPYRKQDKKPRLDWSDAER